MRPLHILLVDDSVEIGDCFREIVERVKDCVCTHVTTGPSAFAELSTSHVDVLVTDFERPGEDISAFVREVRHAHPTLPVLILSGWIPTAQAPRPKDPFHIGKIRAIKAIGADLVAPKPFTPRELAAHIDALMPKVTKHAQAAGLPAS